MSLVKIYRVNCELVNPNAKRWQDGFEFKHNQTLEFKLEDVKFLHIYTGHVASGAICYVDVHFNNNQVNESPLPDRCFMIDGHAAGKQSVLEAKNLGVPIHTDGTIPLDG